MILEAPGMAWAMRTMEILPRTSTLWYREEEVYNLCDMPKVQTYELLYLKLKPMNKTRPAVSGKDT